jgi:tetratricopeptide (TPR) repeat protein
VKNEFAGALEAFRRCIELDAEYADAHYRAGIVLESLERPEEAITSYRRALELEPRRVSAGRRLGLLEYAAGRFEKARDAWLAVEPYAGDDVYLRAQIAQALFALGRFGEAEPWREKVRRLHAAAKDEKVRAMKDFCFDQFVVDDARVSAYELFDRSEDALYRYVFVVARDGKVVLRVNLEPMQAVPELGLPGGFCVGANDDEGHITFKKRWAEEPPYPELQAAVRDAIRGQLPVAIRSRRGG